MSKSTTVLVKSLVLLGLIVTCRENLGTTVCEASVTSADPADTVNETQGRNSFAVDLIVPNNRIIGEMDVNLILETGSSFAAGQRNTLVLTVELGELTPGQLFPGEELTASKASDLEWSIVSGHVSFAYDDVVGECLGPVTMYAYNVSEVPEQWTIVAPPSRTEQIISQVVEDAAPAVLGWLVPPASMLISGAEKYDQYRNLLFGESGDSSPWLYENKYDVMLAPVYEFDGGVSESKRNISKIRFDLPVSFEKVSDLPIHAMIQIRMQCLEDLNPGIIRADQIISAEVTGAAHLQIPSSNEPLTSASSSQTKTINLGNGVTMDFVLIPAGSFYMGSESSEKDRDDDEGPVRRVQITKSFYMSKYEVTQDQYMAVMGTNPSYYSGRNLPVESVSWNDAVAFCEKINVRLPTEAEWEYACRAGSETRFYYGDDQSYSQLNQYAWYSSNSYKTNPVGQKKPNAWDLYDMSGNVWEWCSDWYADSYSNLSMVDPTGPASGEYRVLLGGSHISDSWDCRSASRYRSSPIYRYIGFNGFRVVLDLN